MQWRLRRPGCWPSDPRLAEAGAQNALGTHHQDEHQDDEADDVGPLGIAEKNLPVVADQAEEKSTEQGTPDVADAAENGRREGLDAQHEAAGVEDAGRDLHDVEECSRAGEDALAPTELARWSDLWPITPKPEYSQLKAYFNLDNGSGKIRGIHTEGDAGADAGPAAKIASPDEPERHLDETLAWWRQWASKINRKGQAGVCVARSAIVLKALTHAPTGAIIAAPTTSLPEHAGGERNWDYRFSWIRDSVFATDLSSVHFDKRTGHLALLSDESKRIMELDGDSGNAKSHFEALVYQFPDNSKLPDGMFKLGRIYHQEGDNARAKELLNRVATEYENSGSSAPRLARDYLQQNF